MRRLNRYSFYGAQTTRMPSLLIRSTLRASICIVVVALAGCDSNSLDRTCDSNSYPAPPSASEYGDLTVGSSVVATRDGRFEGSSTLKSVPYRSARYLSMPIGNRKVELSSALTDIDTLSAGGPYHFSAYFGAVSPGQGGSATIRVVRADAESIEGTFSACVATSSDVFNYTAPGSLIEGGFHVMRVGSTSIVSAAVPAP